MSALAAAHRPFIHKINVNDVKKRYKPEKYYCQLLDKYKIESGSIRPEERIIPFLPGKILFGRSNIRSVALERLHPINLYCQKLISLKDEISKSDLVLDFFTLTDDDIQMHSDESLWKSPKSVPEQQSILEISKPIKSAEYLVEKNYKAKTKTELSVRKDTKVNVIEKSLSGWWFVSSSDGQGFIPYCVLETKDNLTPILLNTVELHVVANDYEAKQSDELTIKKSEFVEVHAKSATGFWKVKLFDGSEGLVPAVCLKKVIQNQSVPITLKNSVRFRNEIRTKEEQNKEFAHLPPIKEEALDSSTGNVFAQYQEVSKYKYYEEEKKNLNQSSVVTQAPVQNQHLKNNASSSEKSSSQLIQKNQTVPEVLNEEIFYSIGQYVDTVGDGISFDKGQKFKVLIKEQTNGWWYVQNQENNIEGWAPSSFLAPKPLPKKKPIGNTTKIQLENNQEIESSFLNAINLVTENEFSNNILPQNEDAHIDASKSLPKKEKPPRPEPPAKSIFPLPNKTDQNINKSITDTILNKNDQNTNEFLKSSKLEPTQNREFDESNKPLSTSNELLEAMKKLRKVPFPK